MFFRRKVRLSRFVKVFHLMTTKIVYSNPYGVSEQEDVTRETPFSRRNTKPRWGGGKR